MFDTFLELLNKIRPSIQFTFELSRIEKTLDGSPDLPDNVIECIPFLELNVMRLIDGNYTFSIFRKPCHAGNYLHAYSYQPTSQKSTVIRSLYLRAYRYCDKQFLKEEEQHIQQGFLKLGYTDKFIESCRTSAYKGRVNELKKECLLALQELPFARASVTSREKREPLATITLPYHPSMDKLKKRLNEMDIRLAYNTNSTLGQQLKHQARRAQPKGSVYVVNCNDCPKVYVGQTGKMVDKRMDEHSKIQIDAMGAINKHNASPEHYMDINNPTQVFLSDCYSTRVTVEAALMFTAPTVEGNTASASVVNNELVAPIICKATKFNWNKLRDCIPHLPKEAVPYFKRPLFGNQEIIRAPPELRSIPPPVRITRSRTQNL